MLVPVCCLLRLQLTAARLVIDHTVQQVTGHEGQGDKPQVRVAEQQHSWWLQLGKVLLQVSVTGAQCTHMQSTCAASQQFVLLFPAAAGGVGGVCPHMQVVCQGQATVVFLDDTYRPVRVPAQVKAALAHLHQEYKEGPAGS